VAVVAEREFPAIAVSLSGEVVPELREYERASTTLANAFVQLMDPPARVMGPENLQCAGVD
jgi:N-methylhydantoinase A/oxoprolinase/acetone carboxylase beta subunit